MTRRQTYGERMSDWERQQDERHWRNRLEKAISSKNYDEINELIQDGVYEGYDIPLIDDPKVVELLRKYQK